MQIAPSAKQFSIEIILIKLLTNTEELCIMKVQDSGLTSYRSVEADDGVSFRTSVELCVRVQDSSHRLA